MNDMPASRTALVAEDDRAIRDLLVTTLELEGWTVRTATDGKEAIDALLASAPDLVVVDLMMPHASGLEVLQAMSAHPRLMQVPAIVCTARDTDYERETAALLGAVEWLVKPIDSSALLAAVERATAGVSGS